MPSFLRAPLERAVSLGAHLGIDLFVQRDDLLPFPLAGNKVRKIRAELEGLRATPDVLITNGAIDSNHCRTTAWLGAQLGLRTHLVLHGTSRVPTPATRLLDSLGATYVVVHPDEIASEITAAQEMALKLGQRSHVIPGGCHSPQGARAYFRAGKRVFDIAKPSIVFVASGTGATQGGLVAAAADSGSNPRVMGVSVARSTERGGPAVAEAANWAGSKNPQIEFTDEFVAGGYGRSDERIDEAVALGWRFGLPLDATYTGKAFAAVIDYAQQSGLDKSGRVLFWHTGGLWNQLQLLQQKVTDISE